MKKVGIYQQYWGPMGGGQRFVGFIAQILSENNEVEILHHDPNFDLQKFDEGMELDLSRVAFRCIPRPERPERSTRLPFARLREESEFCREFSEPYDVFLESSDIPPVFNHAKNGVLLTHFPLVSFDDFHGHNLPEWQEKGLMRRLLLSKYHEMEWRCRFSSYQTYLCNSKFTRKWCQRRWGISPQILNPPLRSSIHPGEKKPIILGLGAFSKVNHKRQDVLITAFQEFHDRMIEKFHLNPDWKLRLIGACKRTPEDEEFVEKLRGKACGYPVEILVNVDSQTLLNSLSEATFVWHAMGYGIDEEKEPGRTEHFGMIATEAQAAGAIPMVYHAGGLPEIIHHGMNGFLWSTLRELVETTAAILVEERLLPILETGALKNAENYNDASFRVHLRKVLQGVVDVAEAK